MNFGIGDDFSGQLMREEMLTHVVTHGGYHRGEAGRLMIQAAALTAQDIALPWDTYAVHLHRTESDRRLHGKVGDANPPNAGR